MRENADRRDLMWLGFLVALVLQSGHSVATDKKAKWEPIPDAVWNEMLGKSWRPGLGCPERKNLVLLTVPYLDFQGDTKLGRLIVAERVAPTIAFVLSQAYQSGKFRIERMDLIDKYNGNDHASVTANNTSAFNCRYIGGTKKLSEHSFGTAIDINPVQNPFVSKTNTFPPAGKDYDEPHERKATTVGVIVHGDILTTAFQQQGWSWGGDWVGKKDYQHFSATGH